MNEENRLKISLLSLRFTVFLVMIMWTVDKLFNTAHAMKVYEIFYFITGFEAFVFYIIGALELLLIVAFVIGLWKTFTYGLVFILHAISTLACIPYYLAPFEGPNLLYFAAWPMLAACFTLFMLRDKDKMLAVS